MNKKTLREKYGKKSLFRVFFNKFLSLIAMLPTTSSFRVFLHRITGTKIGTNIFLAPYVFIDDQFPELITIEDNAIISFRTTIIAHDDSRGIVSPVTIKRNAWIGACAIILPGVIVGEKAVVGAGTVIAKDVPSKTTVVGAEIRIINKEREP